jgi:hypothetical protein
MAITIVQNGRYGERVQMVGVQPPALVQFLAFKKMDIQATYLRGWPFDE